MRIMNKNRKSCTKNSPETTIIFTTYGRSKISKKSLTSLIKALKDFRGKLKIIIVDATNDVSKAKWINNQFIDDIIWVPKGASSATSRNLAVELMLDKYSSEFICFVEDDVEYTKEWYPTLLRVCKENYGRISPFNLAYGIFTASSQNIHKSRVRYDEKNKLNAYIFGAVADQRFMPLHHYLSVMRMWDPDILGISYNQTGGQTFRNTVRGYCGGIIPGKALCKLIDGGKSSWVGKKDPGPPAHSFEIDDYKVIMEAVKKVGEYDK